MKLSEHFNSAEFACQCGCGAGHGGADINPRLVAVLEKVRTLLGNRPLIITSGIRCPAHNAEVGGVANSQHLLFTAADVACPDGVSPAELADAAELAGADGIGIYSDFVHIDVRGWRARW